MRPLDAPALQRGFTLIELMVVIAILAILLGVALPAYQESVRKSRRSDAMTALLDTAQRQEQYMLDRHSYTDDMTDLDYAADPLVSDDGYYTIDAAACAGGNIATCYLLTATPVAGTSQSNDSGCTTFTLSSRGERGATGTQAGDCW